MRPCRRRKLGLRGYLVPCIFFFPSQAIDSKTETLVLEKSSEITIETLGLALPPSEPCYAILAWPHTLTGVPRRETG